MESEFRIIAFYLPQYHPIPENDAWWGKGFTEWTNTAKARPLFDGHYQPHVPADLGFYDLRLPEARSAQAEMAREYGIEAFCYYHYWFAGKRLLERPFNDVVASGEPSLPFCLCWANQTWSGIWHGAPDRILVEQTYPGPADHEAHFAALLPAFRDRRYLTVDGKPLFMIYEPAEPKLREATRLWRALASSAGLPGLHLVGWRSARHDTDPAAWGLDAISSGLPSMGFGWRHPIRRIRRSLERRMGLPMLYPYAQVAADMRRTVYSAAAGEYYPCVIPNWDNTPRSGANGLVLQGSTPDLFRVQLRDAFNRVRDRPRARRIVFVKSWNEWAEGNHLEPDLANGRGYLDAMRTELEIACLTLDGRRGSSSPKRVC